MRICLFEDDQVAEFEPLTLTRPVFALRCGRGTLAECQQRFAGNHDGNVNVRPHLAELFGRQHPGIRVNDPTMGKDQPVLFINGRWLPPAGAHFDPLVSQRGHVGGELAYIVATPDQMAGVPVAKIPQRLEELHKQAPGKEVGGRLVEHLWDLVNSNGDQICQDWENLGHDAKVAFPGNPGHSFSLVGPSDHLVCHSSVRIDPLVVIDTRNGPVFLERDVVVAPFTRIEGPAVIGAGSQLLAANLRGGTTLGPQCRIGGEVEASIVQGFSNKYHDGFLGHAYLGEWINLGAGTQTSDLRNDYGEVQVRVNGKLVRTGNTKIGCFLGDHTKSAIGSLLNTGTNSGVFASLLPGGLLPRWIPSFCSWRDGQMLPASDLDKLLRTAEVVMGRRGLEFSAAHERLYKHLFLQSAGERHQAIQNDKIRRFSQSA